MIQEASNPQKQPKQKHAGGRPTKFTPELAIKIFMLARKGLTDKEIGKCFDVKAQTICNWKKNKEFFDSLKENKQEADSIVERSLFERACGYEHKHEEIFCNSKGLVTKVLTIKHYPPDPTAMIFWLKNRQPDKWRDKREYESNLDIPDQLPIVRLYADGRN